MKTIEESVSEKILPLMNPIKVPILLEASVIEMTVTAIATATETVIGNVIGTACGTVSGTVNGIGSVSMSENTTVIRILTVTEMIEEVVTGLTRVIVAEIATMIAKTTIGIETIGAGIFLPDVTRIMIMMIADAAPDRFFTLITTSKCD